MVLEKLWLGTTHQYNITMNTDSREAVAIINGPSRSWQWGGGYTNSIVLWLDRYYAAATQLRINALVQDHNTNIG